MGDFNSSSSSLLSSVCISIFSRALLDPRPDDKDDEEEAEDGDTTNGYAEDDMTGFPRIKQKS